MIQGKGQVPVRKIRVGIIGVGGIACGVHIPELKKCPEAEIAAICDINQERLAKVGRDLGIPEERRFVDYHDLVADPQVEAVEICTPNYLHVPMALAALRAGKHVNIEKPLALSVQQAKPLAEYALAEGQVSMLCFSYRFRPAVRYAKELIEQGKLGRITGVQVTYMKDSALWKGRGMEWRFEKEKAGTGVLGDLGVHLIDMTQLLAGSIQSVCGHTQVIVTERPYPDGSIGKVETDDICSFMARLDNGADATFSINRCAYGHHNTITFAIYGTRGTITFNLNEPDTLWVAMEEGAEEERRPHLVKAPESFRITQEQTFIHAILGKKGDWYPSLEDGMDSQRILDALLKSSQEKRWVDIER